MFTMGNQVDLVHKILILVRSNWQKLFSPAVTQLQMIYLFVSVATTTLERHPKSTTA